jgi:hypothetical protein
MSAGTSGRRRFETGRRRLRGGLPPDDGQRSDSSSAATCHDGSRHACRAVATAVVVDDRVAVCATVARRIVANAGRAAAKQHDAVFAIVERSKDDDAARARRRLPGQPHSPCVDRCRNPEDVCRPHGRGARAALSRPDARLFVTTGSRVSPSFPGLLSQGRRALPGACFAGSARPNLQQGPGRRRVSLAEKFGGGRTCREDDCGEHHHLRQTRGR